MDFLFAGVSLNTIDVVILSVLLLGVCIGIAQGLIRQALTLASLYLAVVLAAQYYAHVSRGLGHWIGGDPVARSAISLALTFVIAAVALNAFGYYLYRQTSLSRVHAADRLIGAALGLIWSWAISGVGLTVLHFAMGISWQDWEADRMALADAVTSSSLAPLITSVLPAFYATLRPWLPLGLPAPFVL